MLLLLAKLGQQSDAYNGSTGTRVRVISSSAFQFVHFELHGPVLEVFKKPLFSVGACRTSLMFLEN